MISSSFLLFEFVLLCSYIFNFKNHMTPPTCFIFLYNVPEKPSKQKQLSSYMISNLLYIGKNIVKATKFLTFIASKKAANLIPPVT